ncbi:MAG TPA: hypothetical protein VMN60_09980 [Longimicrobiales bacterium]|nr:hypothetical protein [Longimicrobiales bacterium]
MSGDLLPRRAEFLRVRRRPQPITPLGLGFAGAAGVTLRSGYMSFPLNVALVSSLNGLRTSALAGFTIRR